MTATGSPAGISAGPGTPLPGLPWSPEFMAAYEKSLSGKVEVGIGRSTPGTISALIASYYGSAEFKSASGGTIRAPQFEN